MSNPFLHKFETPFETLPFDKIKEEHFVEAIDASIAKAKKNIQKIKDATDKETFENVIVALEGANRDLDVVSSAFFNLHSAESNEQLQALAKEISPKLTEFGNDVILDGELFEKVNQVYQQKESLNLDQEEARLLDKTYKMFVRNGAKLSEQQKQELREIDKKLSTLSLHFSDNSLAATNEFQLFVEDEGKLKGLPEAVIEAAKSEAKEAGRDDAWLFTLQYPSFIPVMTYLEDRKIREEMHRAFSSRCFLGDKNDNKEIVLEIVRLRDQRARLLGYKNHASFILEERMASTPERVYNFLDDLFKHAEQPAKNEIKELGEFAAKEGGPQKIENWDYAFWANKLKKERFDFDDESLRPYFKLENVIDGAFKVANKLFGLQFKERRDISTYHQDVKAYEVINEQAQHLGVFYADFFPRKGKRSGAWMTTFRTQWKEGGKNIRPHVSIVCNFTKPSSSRPSLLTFNEVSTLFHEFGHALHELLSQCRFQSLSGASVYWDFVELPSQVLENWCYEKECLDLFARHYETGELIPAELVSRLVDAATFHSGRNTLRQLSLAYLDMAWHTKDPKTLNDVHQVEREAVAHTDLLDPIEGTNTSCSFGHIFAGGYSAGYYSYKWAEVLDADAFEVFKERGIFNREVADSFRENVLSKGGSEDPMELYKRFRGQEPSVKALLRREGLL